MLHWTKDGKMPVAQVDGDGVSFVDMAFVSEEVAKLRAVETQRMLRALSKFVSTRIVRPIKVWHQRQRLYEELGSLSDRTLADMGVTRNSLRSRVNATLPYAANDIASNEDDRSPIAA